MNKLMATAFVFTASVFSPQETYADEQQTLSYSYIEGGYYHSNEAWPDAHAGGGSNIPVNKTTGNGFKVGGAYAFHSNVFLFGDYSRRSTRYVMDIPLGTQTTSVTTKAAFDAATVGLGINIPLGSSTSLHTKAGLVFSRSRATNISSAALSVTDLNQTSGFVELGIRKLIGQRFELSAVAGWSGLYDPGNVCITNGDTVIFNTNGNTYWGIGARYQLTQNVSLGVDATMGTSMRAFASLRYEF